jgi:hypothetical protein
MTDNNRLLKICGVWVRNPDPDTWSPTHNGEWTEGSGRVSSGIAVGAVKYRKWTLPLSWTNIPEADEAFIEELIENAGDYFSVEFYHRCRYIPITAYAGTFTPTGIVNADGEIYYKKCTVKLIEQ